MLHRRASAWYAEQGLIEEAIEHALAAGDASRRDAAWWKRNFSGHSSRSSGCRWNAGCACCRRNRSRAAPSCLSRGRGFYRPTGQLKEMPRLLTAAEQLLATSDSGTSDQDDPQSRILHALIAILWSLFQYFTGQTQASLESARSALEWLPPDEEYIASHALTFPGLVIPGNRA